jgi:chromosome segregation ATPase
MTDADKILYALEKLNTKVDQLENGQKAMQGDMSGIKTDITGMKTDIADLQTGQRSLQDGQKAIREDIKTLHEGQNTVELKVENFHAEQKRANKEIMVTLHDIVEINAKEANERFERIEKHLNLTPGK